MANYLWLFATAGGAFILGAASCASASCRRASRQGRTARWTNSTIDDDMCGAFLPHLRSSFRSACRACTFGRPWLDSDGN